MSRAWVAVLLVLCGCATLEVRAQRGDTEAMAELILDWAREAPAADLEGVDAALLTIKEAEHEPALRALAYDGSRPEPVRKGASKAVALMLAERPGALEKCVAEEESADLLDACLRVAMARNVTIGAEILERLSKNAVSSIAALARKALGVGNPLAALKGGEAGRGEAKEEEEEVPIWMKGRQPDPIFQRHPKKSFSLPTLFGAKEPEQTPSQKRRASLRSALEARDVLAIDKPHLVSALDDPDRAVRALSAAALLLLSQQAATRR